MERFYDGGFFQGGGRRESNRPTVGAVGNDMSRGDLFNPHGADAPVVRRVLFCDTRTRDIRLTPDATRVTFMLDRPMDSVTRICVHSARVPIKIDDYNPGLEAEDYVMLSIGIRPPDTVAPLNLPTRPEGAYVLPPGLPETVPTFTAALAYMPLIPARDNSGFAEILPDTPPHKWFVDFLTPIQTLDRIELSWWRFQKYPSSGGVTRPIEYVIHNSGTPDYGAVDDNAYVTLVFYCKNRRPE